MECLIGFNLSPGRMTWWMRRQKERAEPRSIHLGLSIFLCLRIFVVILNPSLCRFDTWHTRPKYDFKWNYCLVKWTILTHHFSPTFPPSAENVQGKRRVRINEDPLLHIVDDSKSSRVSRVPSFYIGKPLVDFDGSITSVSRTQLLTSKLTVMVTGECTQK